MYTPLPVCHARQMPQSPASWPRPIGLGVDRDERLPIQRVDEFVELFAGGDGGVVAVDLAERVGGRGGGRAVGRLIEEPAPGSGAGRRLVGFSGRRGVGLSRPRLGVDDPHQPAQVGAVAVEAELLEPFVERPLINRARRRIVEVEGEVAVALERDEAAGRVQLAGGDGGLQVLLLFTLELVHPLDQLGYGAKLLDELGGGLRADALDAGDVVGAVADEGLVVDDLLGRDAALLLQRCKIELLIRVGVEKRDAVGQHLLEVLVLGDKADAEVRVLGGQAGGERGEDVVRLVSWHLEDRDAEQPGDVEHDRDLRLKVLGRGRAVALVLGVESVAEGVALAVDGHRDVGGAVLLEELEQQGGEREDGVGRLPSNGRRHPAAPGSRTDRVVRPEHLGMAVDEVEGRGRSGGISHGSGSIFGGASKHCRGVPASSAPATRR